MGEEQWVDGEEGVEKSENHNGGNRVQARSSFVEEHCPLVGISVIAEGVCVCASCVCYC